MFRVWSIQTYIGKLSDNLDCAKKKPISDRISPRLRCAFASIKTADLDLELTYADPHRYPYSYSDR
jgi:hypothetical protein